MEVYAEQRACSHSRHTTSDLCASWSMNPTIHILSICIKRWRFGRRERDENERIIASKVYCHHAPLVVSEHVAVQLLPLHHHLQGEISGRLPTLQFLFYSFKSQRCVPPDPKDDNDDPPMSYKHKLGESKYSQEVPYPQN